MTNQGDIKDKIILHAVSSHSSGFAKVPVLRCESAYFEGQKCLFRVAKVPILKRKNGIPTKPSVYQRLTRKTIWPEKRENKSQKVWDELAKIFTV